MVSGTYVLTDTINAAFHTIFTVAYSKSDAVVSGKQVFGDSTNAPSFPASTLDRIRGLSDVEKAVGGIADTAQFVGRNGKVVTHGGAPNLAFSVDPSGDQGLNPLTLVSGHWPSTPDEVAMDETTATVSTSSSAIRSA